MTKITTKDGTQQIVIENDKLVEIETTEEHYDVVINDKGQLILNGFKVMEMITDTVNRSA